MRVSTPRRPRFALALAFSCATVCAFAQDALAETRVALVIGNAAYKHAPALANPKHDAEGMAASLRRLGFEVLAGTDLDKPAMERLLRDFAQKIEQADVALVFYAGHGLQVNGRNYFVPVDSKLERESDLDFEAVSLELVQRVMEQGTRTNIIVLDACRDNPLARNLARSMGTRSAGIGRGLGQTQAGVGTLIVYATQPGNVALDGDTKNSPFTEALLKHIEAPGLEVRLVVSRVRQAVIAATKGKQVPWDSSSLVGEVYLAAKPAAAAPSAPEAKPAAPDARPPATTDTPPRGAPNGEVVFWQSIKDSKNAADYKDYLARWPGGTFAALAKRRLAELEKAAVVTPPAPPPAEKPSPQRGSTFEVGTYRTGDLISPHDETANAPGCQARCIGNPQCAAWTWHGPESSYARKCYLIKHVNQRMTRRYPGSSMVTSGVIRTAPAAGPAQPARPQPGAAPGLGDALARELVRKARGREREDGFCTRVGWPVRNPTPEVLAVLPPGGVVLYRMTRFCGLVRAGRATLHNGIWKRSMTWSSCEAGGICEYQHKENFDCRDTASKHWTMCR